MGPPKERLAARTYLISHHAAWWALAGLLVGYGAAIVSHRLSTKITGSKKLRRVLVGVAVIYITSPVLWYLTIQGTRPGEPPIGWNFLTQVMFTWVTISVGFFTYWLPHSSKTRGWLARSKLFGNN